MHGKALIIGPDFFGYNESIRRAFRKNGFEARVAAYDDPVHPFDVRNRVLHKLFPSWKHPYEKGQRLFAAEVKRRFDDFRPDLVFIYNGDLLEKETIRYFRRRAKVAVWMLDGALLHPRSLAIAPETDAYFCFERSDVGKLHEMGIGNARFLPQGYDPEIYHPLPGTEKDIDILFVGALYRYPERIRLLTALARRWAGRYRIRIYGRYKPFEKNPVKWLLREQRSVFLNRNVPPAEVNRLYNRAKVCINIHHAQSADGANPKVFEICGAGAYQVVDANPFIEEIYGAQEAGLYRNDREFLEKIEAALAADVSAGALAAHRKAAAYHTFECRIREALRVLGYPE